jgi:hypothetical protein
LDSLVRNETYQWVTRDKSRKIFPRPFPLALEPSGRDLPSWPAQAQNCSSRKLSLISGFLQDIVVIRSALRIPVTLYSTPKARLQVTARSSHSASVRAAAWSDVQGDQLGLLIKALSRSTNSCETNRQVSPPTGATGANHRASALVRTDRKVPILASTRPSAPRPAPALPPNPIWRRPRRRPLRSRPYR